MELGPGYEQTVPADWDVVLLDSVARRGSGHTPDKAHPEYWGGTLKWISLQDSERLDRLYIYDTAAKITPSGIANSSAKIHPSGTVVLSRDAGVGKSAIMKGDMAVSQHFIAWTCGPSLNNHFLYYWLQSNKSEFERIAMGNTIKTIGLPYFRRLAIPLPRKAEQEAIAKALNGADALIESLQQLLAKKRQLKQGAMQELLTGKRRLPGFSGRWESSRLQKFVRQFIVPMRDKPKRLTGDFPWCRIEDFDGTYLTGSKSGQGVNAETVRAMNLKVYPAGTLLVSCSADLGRCAIVTRPLVSNQTFIGLEMDEAASSNLFFYYFMTSRAEELNNLSTGTTISYLSRAQFEDFVVYVPLDRDEQAAIAGVLADMDAEIAALETKVAKSGQLKQGIMQVLLTGRIRLV